MNDIELELAAAYAANAEMNLDIVEEFADIDGECSESWHDNESG